MESLFSKDKIIRSAISPYDHYCVGYPGQGAYITTLVVGIGSVPEKNSHAGSKVLDSILAFDQAEITDSYLGQINMIAVSSFCGPQGLIWGYDIATLDDFPPDDFLLNEKLAPGVKIKSGKNLRQAAQLLFGKSHQRHFPFLPGSHVPCAGRSKTAKGPADLYAAVAIGIPEKRDRQACVLMEDAGELKGNFLDLRQSILRNIVESVIEIGRHNRVKYGEIFVDFLYKKILPGEIGCALVAMPYFHLAKSGFNKNLLQQKMNDWVKASQQYFLE